MAPSRKGNHLLMSLFYVFCTCAFLMVLTLSYETNQGVFFSLGSAKYEQRDQPVLAYFYHRDTQTQQTRPVYGISSKATQMLSSTSPHISSSVHTHKSMQTNAFVHINTAIQLSPACSPKQRIVFLKTHKTGSTTMTSIFQRYGYYRNLTFAIGRSHVISYANVFNRNNLLKFPGMEGKNFDILMNHARYNRLEMNAVVPNATYITIIRKPEDRVASAFGYFEMYQGMKLQKKQNPLKSSMEDPMKYYKNHKYHKWQMSRNGMLFDLGFDLKYEENMTKVHQKILQLQEEFDLVLLTEYFDESLVLLRKLLCWDFEDILYVPKSVRSASHRYEKDEALRKKLRNWSQGDMLLYEYFNKTFWDKVQNYGPSFNEDVARFRTMNKAVFDRCVNVGRMDKKDRREDKFTLKNNSEKCAGLLHTDVSFTRLIRQSMVSRFGGNVG